mgnify:FL=1|tara:strand:- start:221 stop:607 length:387 start_codon:yes stop_codon:yes gene_type:complete
MVKYAGEITMSWEEILKKELYTFDEINQEWVNSNTLMILQGRPMKYVTLFYRGLSTNYKKPTMIASYVQRSGNTHLSIDVYLSDTNDFPINSDSITFNEFSFDYDVKVTEQEVTEDGLKTRKKEFKFN